jgi:hypothetical protein
MTYLKLHHIGEPLVAAMLQKIEAAGRLSNLVCPRTHVSVEDSISIGSLQRPFAFLPERASLSVSTESGRYICDGAQKVDVLCAGGERAIALELKLGEERLRANEFESRFMEDCATSHGESRLKGKMVSVLERRFPWPGEATLRASAGTENWKVVKPWWLVVRKSVWDRWRKSNPPNLSNGRILVLEEVVRELGGETAFNGLVRDLVCDNFFSVWGLDQ